MLSQKTLMILGAQGLMGRRIARLSRKLLPNTRIIETSRKATGEGDTRAVDIHRSEELKTAFEGVNAVINTVGPFDYDPTELLRACSQAGCHYIDIADPPEFIEAVERSNELGNIYALSGCSTIPALVDVLTQHWAQRPNVTRMRISLGMGSANPVSPVLIYCLLRPLGQPAPDGSRYFHRLRLKAHKGVASRLYGTYPALFDRQGLRAGDRILPAAFYVGMDRRIYSYMLRLAAPLLSRLSDRALLRFCHRVQWILALTRRLGTTVGILSVEALDDQKAKVGEIEIRALNEGLDIPSLPSVWTARRFLEPEGVLSPGSLRMDQLFTPTQVTQWLRKEGYSVTGVE